MNASIYRITLDLQEAQSDVLLNVNRGDTNRILRISLTDGGRPYQISKDCRAVFTAIKPDGKKVFNDCEIRGNEILYALTPQTVAVEGVCECEIKLYGANDHLLTSSRFDLVINETVYNEGDELESSNEADALTRWINDAVDKHLEEVVIPKGGGGDNSDSAYFEMGVAEIPGVANGVSLDITNLMTTLSNYYGKWVDENWWYTNYQSGSVELTNGFTSNRIVSKALAGKPYFRIPCKSGDQYYLYNSTNFFGSDSPNALTEEGHTVTKCTKNTVVFVPGDLPNGESDGGMCIISPVEDYPYYYIEIINGIFGQGRYGQTNPTLVAAFDASVLDNPFMEIEIGTTTQEYLEMKDKYLDGYYRNMFVSDAFKSIFKDYFAQMAPKVGLPQTYGKKCYIGGDSLHAYSGGDGHSTSGFVTDWNKHLGFNVVNNAGYAGSTWSGTSGGGGIKRVTDLVAEAKPYDVFVLAWGTNIDTGGDGTISDEASNADGCTMVAAMKWCITQLRTAFPKSAIGVIIPPPKHTDDGMNERGDLMVDVCELLHVRYVDMRRYLGIADISSDKVHLGAGGAVKYGAAEAKLILEICPYGEPLS